MPELFQSPLRSMQAVQHIRGTAKSAVSLWPLSFHTQLCVLSINTCRV